MADKLMYILNELTRTYLFCRLQLNKPTNQNSMKVPKFVKPTNKKMLSKKLGTSFKINLNVPSLPAKFQQIKVTMTEIITICRYILTYEICLNIINNQIIFLIIISQYFFVTIITATIFDRVCSIVN